MISNSFLELEGHVTWHCQHSPYPHLTLHWPYITNALFCRVKTLVEHVAIWIFTPVCLLLGWMYQTLMACLDCVCVRETLVLRSQLGAPGFAVYSA